MSILQDDDPYGQQGRPQNQEHGPAAYSAVQKLRQEVHAQAPETQTNLIHDMEDRSAGVGHVTGSNEFGAASQGVLLRRGAAKPQVSLLQWPSAHGGRWLLRVSILRQAV